ncbi:MAG: hypothetical protein ACM3PR_11495 [Bacteroidales bacterium]
MPMLRALKPHRKYGFFARNRMYLQAAAMPGAYKEPLTASVFILAILIIALVAFVTISYHVLKVATQNPVKALRYE